MYKSHKNLLWQTLAPKCQVVLWCIALETWTFSLKPWHTCVCFVERPIWIGCPINWCKDPAGGSRGGDKEHWLQTPVETFWSWKTEDQFWCGEEILGRRENLANTARWDSGGGSQGGYHGAHRLKKPCVSDGLHNLWWFICISYLHSIFARNISRLLNLFENTQRSTEQ